VWSGASVLVFVMVVDYLVLPQLAGTERSLHLLRSANLSLIVAAVVLESASLLFRTVAHAAVDSALRSASTRAMSSSRRCAA
jgi:hypothetical protein